MPMMPLLMLMAIALRYLLTPLMALRRALCHRYYHATTSPRYRATMLMARVAVILLLLMPRRYAITCARAAIYDRYFAIAA